MSNEKAAKAFTQLLKKQSIFKQHLVFLQWDTHVNLPSKGLTQRLDLIGSISEQLYELNTSEQMKDYIDQFKDQSSNSLLQQAACECEALYERERKIPQALNREFTMLKSESEAVWQEARKQSDFSMFQPYLEKMVSFNREFTDYWGYGKDRYDALLGHYEPGVEASMVDELFPPLRKSLLQLIERINDSDQTVDESIIKADFPIAKQKALSLALLSRIGFDHDAGRLDVSAHPYTFALNKHDLRITTRYNEKDFRESVFSTLHEGGHALYEQNFADELNDTPLSEVSSMGMHESQALLWEKYIGGSRAFWESNLDLFKSYAPAALQHLTIDEIYHSIHKVETGLIRIEADEVTYPLHIMLRYELEKDLLNGEVKVADLPSVWNEKMGDYLGVKPNDDRKGVLQDIHWASGDFGYFPSYVLGMMYAAQFYQAMDKTFDLNKTIRTDELYRVNHWLSSNIYQHGKTKKPLDLIQDVTAEPLNPHYLVAYLEEKYREIYKL